MLELHISDVRTYLSCRRRWNWSSPLRENLEPVRTPKFFLQGKAIHYALGSYYENGEKPSDIYLRYMQKEMRKLSPLWPDEQTEFDALITQGTGMLDNYIAWMNSEEAPDARWRIVDTEIPFDPIELANGIALAGRIDGIVQDVETDEYWLREYKTAGRAPELGFFDFDNQVTAYCYAASHLLGKPVVGVQFRFLLKKVPGLPSRIRNGTQLSRAINSPQVMTTTYSKYLEGIHLLVAEVSGYPDTYVHTAMNLGDTPSNEITQSSDFRLYLQEVADAIEQYSDVLGELQTRGYSEYFVEHEVRKTEAEIDTAIQELIAIGNEMSDPKLQIYRAPEWYKCQFCAFKAPCKSLEANANYQVLLQEDYRLRVPEEPIEL